MFLEMAHDIPYKNKTIQMSNMFKGFFKKRALTLHSRMHTGEKTYKCNICPSVFTCTFYLKPHKETHNAEQKPFECYYCPWDFSDESALRIHTKSHTGDS